MHSKATLIFFSFLSAALESYDAVHHLVTHEIGSTMRAARQPLTHGRFLLSFTSSSLFHGSLPLTGATGTKTPSFTGRPKTEALVVVD